MSTARLNPLSIPKPLRVEIPFEVGPDSEGRKIKGVMRKLDTPLGFRSGERMRELIEKYIDGTDDDGPLVIPNIDPEDLTKTLLRACAMAEIMVHSVEGGDPYNAEEYIGLFINVPQLGMELWAKMNALNEGNPQTQTTGTSSESASSIEQ